MLPIVKYAAEKRKPDYLGSTVMKGLSLYQGISPAVLALLAGGAGVFGSAATKSAVPAAIGAGLALPLGLLAYKSIKSGWQHAGVLSGERKHRPTVSPLWYEIPAALGTVGGLGALVRRPAAGLASIALSAPLLYYSTKAKALSEKLPKVKKVKD